MINFVLVWLFCLLVFYSQNVPLQINQKEKWNSPCRAGVESTVEIVLYYKKVLKKVEFFSCYFWDSARLCKLTPLKVGIKNVVYSWNWLWDTVKVLKLKPCFWNRVLPTLCASLPKKIFLTHIPKIMLSKVQEAFSPEHNRNMLNLLKTVSVFQTPSLFQHR